MDTNNIPKSGAAIASLILGAMSFVPLIGVLLGVIAIVLGIVAISQINKEGLGGIKLAKIGIVLGVLGIIFTVLFYSLIFYFGFKSKTGPWAGQRIAVIKKVLIQDAGAIELYKKKYGEYPENLTEVFKAGFQIFPTDFYMRPIQYKLSADGQSYELFSLGFDGVAGTSDDIFLPE